MSRLARAERGALCDLALEVGADAPTLSGDWTVKDLVVHLLVREGSPSAVGILVPPFARFTAGASRRLAARGLPELVQRLRQGPPVYSPFRLPVADEACNTLEFFVHHEDIRRAQETWAPRELDASTHSKLWRVLRVVGKGLVRSAPVGVVLERSDTGERAELRGADRRVVVRGLPSELAMFVYGRQAHSRVELVGPESDREALVSTSLGL